MYLLWFFLTSLVWYCNIKVVLAAGAAFEYGNCTRQKSLRFANFTVRKANGTILGRLLVCEDNAWKNLCDTNWTQSDAKVACRTFQYSPIGARNILNNVVTGGTHSRMEVKCNGSENQISDCEYRDNGITGNCMITIALQCFESNYSSFSTSIPMTLPNNQQQTQLLSSSMNSNGTTNPTPSDSGSESSNSMLKLPNLYYFIIGVAAVVIAMILLVLVMMIFCCYEKLHSKEISPYSVERQNRFIKEKDTITLQLDDLAKESTKINGGLMVHHQLQQSGPVYEAIQSNESSSSPHSQETPSYRSLVTTNAPSLSSSPQGSELYSLVNSTDAYLQLEVHIPITALTVAEPPNSDSGYQQLDHKTSSLTRHMMPIHAVNRSAVAQGLLQEEEFLEQENRTLKYASFSLPRDACLFSHRSTSLHNRSLERPNMEVQPRFDDDSSNNVDHNSDQKNFYQSIESSPDYTSVKEIDEGSEISTNGLCNNCITRKSHENSIVNPLKHHSSSKAECPGNSEPPSGLHTSSHSSLTCSLSSSSAQISRASNGSPLVIRDYIKSRTVESPELLKKKLDCNYSEIGYAEFANAKKFLGHSDGYTFTLV